jgi:hypothetical protein
MSSITCSETPSRGSRSAELVSRSCRNSSTSARDRSRSIPRLLEIGPRLLEALEIVLGAIEPGLEIGEPRPDQAQMCKDFLLVEAPSHDLEGRHGAAWV